MRKSIGSGRDSGQYTNTASATIAGTGGTIEYLRDAVFNYPTLAEAYKAAALNGLNRL